MSFRDVGREDRAGPVARPRHRNHLPNLNGRQNRHKLMMEKGKYAEATPQSEGLLYGRLRLVPSSSCESSTQTQTDDQQSTSLSKKSSSFGSISSQDDESLSLNSLRRSSNPQSGSVSASRGTPGFSTSRRFSNPKMRGWSQLAKGPPLIHSTDAFSQKKRPSSNPQQGSTMSSRRGSPATSLQPTNPQQQASKDTEYAELVTEMKHFRKMVAKLHTLIAGSTYTSSPEQEWRCRILVRSCEDSSADIADKLYRYEESPRCRKSASRKLQKDYQRAQLALEETLLERQRQQQQQQQQQAVNHGPAEASDPSLLLQQEEEEDFFERATRERQEEIERISHKMRQVNDIYQDLAALVDGQQEQIDAVEDNVHAAKSSVKKGLIHIEYARDRLCVMGDEGYEVPQCGGVEDVDGVQPRQNQKTKQRSAGRGTKSSHWSTFQTLQQDILGLGNDLASLGCTFSDNIECGMGKASVYEEGGEDIGSLVG